MFGDVLAAAPYIFKSLFKEVLLGFNVENPRAAGGVLTHS